MEHNQQSTESITHDECVNPAAVLGLRSADAEAFEMTEKSSARASRRPAP